MRVKHKATDKEYEVLTLKDYTLSEAPKHGHIYARTNSDIMQERDPEKYNRLEQMKVQYTIYYVEEPLSDFEILEK